MGLQVLKAEGQAKGSHLSVRSRSEGFFSGCHAPVPSAGCQETGRRRRKTHTHARTHTAHHCRASLVFLLTRGDERYCAKSRLWGWQDSALIPCTARAARTRPGSRRSWALQLARCACHFCPLATGLLLTEGCHRPDSFRFLPCMSWRSTRNPAHLPLESLVCQSG